MYFRPLRLFKILVIFVCILIGTFQVYRSLYHSIKNPLIIKQEAIKTKLKFNGDFEEISSKLQPFTIRFPNFSDDEAKSWFYNSTYYKINSKKCPENSCEKNGVLFNEEKDHLLVKIAFVKNGLYLNDDCGYNYGDIAVKRKFRNESEVTNIYDKAFIYTVPDGWSFQHFLDGIGPKLSHSRSYLDKYPHAKVLILRGARFDRSVKEIWSMLGLIFIGFFLKIIIIFYRSRRTFSTNSLFTKYESRCSFINKSMSYTWYSSSFMA
jgi:hypothetical protein